MRVLVCSSRIGAEAAAAQAQPRNPYYGEPPDFFGAWNNVEVQRSLVTRIEINPIDGPGDPRVRVVVFGVRDGRPCVFGEFRGRFFVSKYPKEREQDNSAVLVKVEHDWVHGHVLLRFNGRGEIVSHALLRFEDRGDVYSVERFAAAAAYGGGEPEDYYQRNRRPPYYRGY